MRRLTMLIGLLFLIGQQVYAQTFEDYFKEAAEHNPGLQSKYKEFEAAMQQVTQAKALPDPTFSFGYFISPVETRVGPQQAKFSLSQMFPWFGTLKAKGEVATALAESKYQAFLNTRNQLYAKVATAYYPLYELNQWRKIEQENIELLESFKNIATAKFRNGKGAMVDVLRVDLMLKEANTNLGILDKKEGSLQSWMNSLLNRSYDAPITIADTLQVKPLPIGYGRDSLLTANPEIGMANSKIEASTKAITLAEKEGMPKLGVGLDYVAVGTRSDMAVSDNGKDVLMPMVSVSIPLFRGKYKAAETQAQLQREQYILEKEETENRLVGSYYRNIFELERQADLITLYEQQISESKQALNLLFTAYSNSGEAFEEVLRMQQQLLLYEKTKAAAVASYHTLLAQLDALTGNLN
ncbi:TolC family protein [Limibacter armeniacum]|uniref:TolC family protein n=1 Tax=Limibacter armeniacum TaxID=466084 RepID=UPI002FE63867